MARPNPAQSPVQLVVEGNDQRNFFEALCTRTSSADIQIQNFGAVTELQDFLEGLVGEPGFREFVESVGIVRDADESEADAFRSVQGALRNAGLPVPDRPGERAAGHPSASVLILPGAGRPGMLETLLCESLADELVNQCIDEFFQCVGEASIKNMHKARAFAYLATRPEPRHSVGVAALRGQWDLEHAAFEPVRRFLEDLADGARTAGTLGARSR